MAIMASLVSVRVQPFDSGRDAISSPATDTDAVPTSGLADFVPAFDGFRATRVRADVDRRRADQLAESFLFEDVGAPPGGTTAGEHRRHHVGRHPREVQDHRGPELDIGLDRPVRTALA